MKDEQLPLYHAKGWIIETFGGCYGEWVMIEIENPKDIGSPGSFTSPGANSGVSEHPIPV